MKELLKHAYIRGIMDCLNHILLGDLNLEQIKKFQNRITETFDFKFQDRILNLMSK